MLGFDNNNSKNVEDIGEDWIKYNSNDGKDNDENTEGKNYEDNSNVY